MVLFLWANLQTQRRCCYLFLKSPLLITPKTLLFISHTYGRKGWMRWGGGEKSSREDSIWKVKDHLHSSPRDTASQTPPLTDTAAWILNMEQRHEWQLPSICNAATWAVSLVIQGRKISPFTLPNLNSHPSREKPKAMSSFVSSKMTEAWGNKPLFQLKPVFPHPVFPTKCSSSRVSPNCTQALLQHFVDVVVYFCFEFYFIYLGGWEFGH